MMAALAADCSLVADALHARAIADTGPDDFGPDDYRERLDVYLAALPDIGDMHAPGIVNFFGAALAVAEEPTTADRAADPPPRDPRHRTPAMITYTARMHRSPVPVEEIAAACIDRLELMLTRLVRDRGAIAPGGSIDVPFDDFMADEVGVAERVYGLVGEPLTDDARTAMSEYLAGHQRGRLGRVVTTCEMFGLNEDELRERFSAVRQPIPVVTGVRDWRASCTRIAARQTIDRIATAIAKVTPAVCNPNRRAASPSPTTGSEIATYATTK
jgi:hypothetical protein